MLRILSIALHILQKYKLHGAITLSLIHTLAPTLTLTLTLSLVLALNHYEFIKCTAQFINRKYTQQLILYQPLDLHNHLVIINHLLHEPGVSEKRLGTGPVWPGVEEDADGLHHCPHQLRWLGEGSDLG